MRSDNTAHSSPEKPVAAGGSQIQYQGPGSTIYSHHNLQPGTSTTTCTHTHSFSLSPKLQFSNFYPNLTLPPLNLIKYQRLLQAPSLLLSAAAVLFLRSDPDCWSIAAAAPP